MLRPSLAKLQDTESAMTRQAEMVDAFVPGDLELKLAHQLLSTEDGISRRVLYDLLGRPKRYSELKPVLPEGKSENSLTVALKTLRRNGLIDQRTDAREAPVVHRYEITPLGIQVVLTIQQIQPLQQQLSILQKAKGGSSSRDVWHVTPHAAGGWRVKREGTARASGVYDTKKKALQAARVIAKKRPEGRVTVHRKDGSIQRQVTPSKARA